MCKIDWSSLGTWVQAISSLGALFFLYKTLRSQNRTLIAQQEINKLEIEKYKNSIMPIFTIDRSKSSNYNERDGYRCIIHLICNYNITIDLSFKQIINPYGFNYKIDNIYNKEKVFAVNDSIEIEVTFSKDQYNLLSLSDPFETIFSLGVYFRDKNNNEYFQELRFTNCSQFHITKVKDFIGIYPEKLFGT